MFSLSFSACFSFYYPIYLYIFTVLKNFRAKIVPVAKYRFSPYSPLLPVASTMSKTINKENINSLSSNTLINKPEVVLLFFYFFNNSFSNFFGILRLTFWICPSKTIVIIAWKYVEMYMSKVTKLSAILHNTITIIPINFF